MIDLDKYYQMHLDWMYENQPSLVRSLLEKDQLVDHLETKMQQALESVEKIVAAGKSMREAYQIVSETILAPADGPAVMQDPAPRAIPAKEQNAIWDRLEAQVLARNKREAEEMN
jgi:uncharacterized protein YoaH (UPF0181 family)